MKITRIDLADSFQTKLLFEDNNMIEEVLVYSWEVDNIEQVIKSMSWTQIKAYKSKTGTKVIKT